MEVDSHHHLWVPDPVRFPWLAKPGLAGLNRAFGLADLGAAAAGTGIGATVVVQAADDIAETEELLALADGSAGQSPGRPAIAGVVGWLDLTDRHAPAALARLLAGPGGRGLAGALSIIFEIPVG